jgi:ABC-type transport system involved in multi-copper enzyme maturation permease subunit
MTGGLVSLPVLRATFRERALGGLSVAFVVLAALGNFAKSAQAGHGAAFADFPRFFIIALTLVLGAGLISDEIDSGHAQLVMLRPVTRAEWFGGRLAGAALVLLGGVAVAWLAGLLGLLRTGGPDLVWLLSLPAAWIEAAAWLAVLAMLSVVFRRSLNVGVLLLLAMAYVFLSFTLPLMLRKVELLARMKELASYLGPMTLGDIPASLNGPRRNFAPLFYDLLWLFGSWLAGVALLNKRELARRRG